ncbi:pyocin knob domain-containing protein [Zhenhengia yiwuensis]|uniref:pyocin knob domain-containing protein n=1 Tax=Zhenhengia yiwuensis TaxID=2763666 RepID=UPI002A761468|nr:pyocin knob domain-containing protein [Zhenhengia yiwuensis]MDY3367456.1 pyocin knob domain-containing protein [Zhenhengia yiwuensis]
MKNTTNYGLKKPDGTDAVDIAIINQNMDTIDTRMKSNATQISDLKEQVDGLDVSWDGITGKPTTFPPSTHSHAYADIAGKPSTFPPSPHNHSMDDVSYGNSLWASVDLNTYTQTGAWYISSDAGHTNAPSGLKYFTLVVEKYGKSDGSYIRQTVQDAVNHTQYTRTWRGANNGWGTWKTVDADTLDGKHAIDFPLKSQGIGANAPLWSGYNLDSLPVGTYTTVASGVPEAGIYHIVTCQLNNIGDCGWQMAVSQNTTSKKVYMRVKAGNVWSDWKSLGEGGGDVAGKTYVKATKTVENTGNPNSNLEVINYSNSKGGVCKIAQFGSAKMQIIVDGAMVLDGTGTNSYYSNHEFLMGDLSDGYGELPTYPFKNNVKVVDRSSNAGTRVYTAHFYVNS